MNMEKRLKTIEKAVAPKGNIPENEKLQIIKGHSINGEFVPVDSADTVESRKVALIAKYGTINGVTFVDLIEKFVMA
ncbi:MAG: hypothetical protein ABFD50_08380 [Smithella sp.]